MTRVSILSGIEIREAIVRRDPSFDGLFFYGVITTGVFCQASCSSRQAKYENMRFFNTLEEVMGAGFKPCKRCKPVNGNLQIEKLIEVARYIEQHFNEKLTLASLCEIADLSSTRLQKTFKKTFGISPKSYQDAVRLRHFKASLKKGDGITDAIYSAGFGSISRVYGEAARHIGMAPKVYRAGGFGEEISYATHYTEMGYMMMAATTKGICSVQFGDDKNILLSELKVEFPKADLIPSTAQNSFELNNWMEALALHINEGAPRPDLPIDMRGTAFQMKVWLFLLSIKEGDVLSYGEVAKQIGKPKAARAVGTACGKNKIGLLIPCHRVLRNNGELGGYRWGLERKQLLLDKEYNKSNGSD